MGHELDKGFNIKFIYRPKDISMPNIAIGLDDFAGTGYFTKEYLVTTKDYNNTKFSIGIGWGKFAGEKGIKNPIGKISNTFYFRPPRSDNYNMGGSPSYDQWFRGEAAFFGGLEHKLSQLKGLKLKIEYDPFSYFDLSANNRPDIIYSNRTKDSNINIGVSYSINEYLTLGASFIKGNMFNLSFNAGITFNENLKKRPKFEPNIVKSFDSKPSKDIFYKDLLFNLNQNKLLLQTATLDDKTLDISISTSQHRNAIRSSSYASYIAKKVANHSNIDLHSINVAHINAGIELNNISYVANYFDDHNITPIEVKLRNTSINSGEANGYLNDDFKPTVNFPVIFTSISPSVDSHIGNPEKFYFGGINIQHIGEIQFSRNLILSSELIMPVYGNFTDTVSGSASMMEHVRTDLVQYLKEDDLYIKRLQLDYIWSPKNNIYAKISGGLFEKMYGGVGFEVLYKPFNENFSLGFELFSVRQRSFKQRFDFKEYKTVTGHFNIGYKFIAGIESNLSIGRYLAKDDGYTLDIGRTTKSGFKAGIYFSRTNVSAEIFGEGSFDKGFYFQIPMDLFTDEFSGNYTTVKISPLTRDGGAKLIHDKDLKGLIYNSTTYELSRQFDGYLN